LAQSVQSARLAQLVRSAQLVPWPLYLPCPQLVPNERAGLGDGFLVYQSITGILCFSTLHQKTRTEFKIF
jgi:hypothetical protein